jgi:hypothetical protein
LKLKLIILSCVVSFILTAQEQKHLEALSIQSDIKIDGELNESIWSEAKVASGFTQTTPVFGNPATQKTEVKVLYDNNALYVSAVMHEPSIDSITKTLSNRDDFGNADYFGVMIDTYGSSTIGFGYLVTSAGVQIDDLHSSDGIDNNWNSVWESAVTVYEDKWIAEIKIPFAALRFPNQDVQNWRINFNRSIRRNREDAFWNTYNPNGLNFLSQFGYLDNVKGIKSPIRLSLYPYVSAYAENRNQTTNFRFNAGMDLKYGINEAFTVDMTLIPDFGQVKFDQQVLNLSPFEVQFNENRQFFTEGTELFNKAGLFYSRRVGAAPINQFNIDKNENEIVTSNPGSTPLLNATKISGRTKSGLGIGFFNGITRPVEATLRDTVTKQERQSITSPLSNFNVLVFDQNLKNNSSVTLTNTSVWRAGKTYDANVTAINFDLFEKSRTYNAYGDFNFSQKYSPLNSFGIKSSFGLEKASGLLKYGINANIADDKFDSNDLGFLSRNNFQRYNLFVKYNTVKPFWKIYNSWHELYVNYDKLFTPNVYTNASTGFNIGATLKNFTAVGFEAGYRFKNNDYFESRIDGKYFTLPNAYNVGGWISSNYANPFALDINLYTTRFNDNWYSNYIRISPRFRFSDKLSMILRSSIDNSYNEKGLALTTNYNTILEDDNPIFGQRNRQTIENSIRANYIFTNRMGLSFELRHYWAKVRYSNFYTLNNIGNLNESNYSGVDNENNSLHNNNFNAFTIDMVYRWVFAPGSELSLVWKNSLFSSSNIVDINYFENTNNLSELPATNGFSFKLLYFLDYNTVFKKK